MRAFLPAAFALMALAVAATASAQPTPDPRLGLCDDQPCVEPVVRTGDGVQVGYRHHVGLGGAGGVKVSEDDAYVYYAEGITSCRWGIRDGSPTAGCVF